MTSNYSTRRNHGQAPISVEHAVTRILAESAEPIDAAPKIIEAVCEHLGWDVGVFWRHDQQTSLLSCVNLWHTPALEIPEFDRVTRQTTYGRGIGLPGMVWATNRHLWFPDMAAEMRSPEPITKAWNGVHAGCGFPISDGDEILGVMGFFNRTIREPDEQLLGMMTSITSQFVQFIERRRAEQTVRDRDREFAVARRIQFGLRPKSMPELPGFAFAGTCNFCEETGGDYYDFFPLQDSCLGIAVGDASGHGIGSALVIQATRAILRALAMTCFDPGVIATLANRCLTNDLSAEHFVTLFLARLDPESRSLMYCSAGHPSGLVLDHTGELRTVLASTGIPLGLDLNSSFRSVDVLTLHPGDLIFVYTDGVSEAFSPHGALFGSERALKIVRAHREQSPAEIVQSLLRAVAEFSGDQPQHDDITAIVIKVDAS
jgi:serine phosphatase RsbU (regulator of sigma subunit)